MEAVKNGIETTLKIADVKNEIEILDYSELIGINYNDPNNL